jgi:CheY-like chemotaxis protein
MGKAPVLIADPDARVASLAAHALRKEGLEALVAHRGEDALAMLASGPSLVLCEATLPGLDGFALCENARKEPATREVAFFLLSRHVEKAERDRMQACRADDLLAKPLYARDLVTLARLFAGRRNTETEISGDLAELPLFYLLRALTSGVRSGELVASDEKATVHFRDGRIVEATAGTLAGDAAVARLLVLSQGPFTLKLGPVLLRGSLSYSLRDMVTYDEPRRRRVEQAVKLMGGPQALLAIDFAALTRELPRLPPSIEKIVRLFDSVRTLGEALRASDLEEVTSAEAVLRLRMAGVLVEARPAVEGASPRGEVKLFEPRNDEALLEMQKLFPTGPAPAPVEITPKEIRDWMEDIGQRGSYQDLLAVKDGGWVAQGAAEAGKQLREIGGDEATSEIDKQIDALEEPRPPEPVEPPAPAPAAAPAAATAAPSPALSPPAPPLQVRVAVPLSPPPTAAGKAFDEDEFFATQPVFNQTTGRLATALVVIGCVALGIGAAIGVRYIQQARQRAALESTALPEPIAAPTPAPTPTPPEPAPDIKNVPAPEPEPEVKAEPAPEPAVEPKPTPEVKPEPPGVDVNALLAQGKALYERGQAEASLKPLEAAAQAAPGNPDLMTLLALARLDAGQTEAAEEAARRAVQLSPENPNAHLALGSVLQTKEQMGQARAEFELYLKLAPRGQHAADVRAILGSMH